MHNTMHTVHSAMDKVRSEYNAGNSSATLYNIYPECAKRVYELLSCESMTIQRPIIFHHSVSNVPSATFSFNSEGDADLADLNVQ